jgi:CheY-like chemotaxis protein
MTLPIARPGTFLVVDDSALHHQMYRLIFSKGPLAGSTVVLLDLNMPEMNGLEFLVRRQAEKLHLHVPIVLVTTESTPEDEARGRAAGAWDYLRKPFQPADIERLVARLQSERAPAA